jgi:hypothetical protein
LNGPGGTGIEANAATSDVAEAFAGCGVILLNGICHSSLRWLSTQVGIATVNGG